MFVVAGQLVPATATAGVVSSPYASYWPSPVEIAIVLGAGAFVALGYTLAERYLDLSESELHFGFPVVAAARRARSGGVALYESLIARWQRLGAEPMPDDVGPARLETEVVQAAAIDDLEAAPEDRETSAAATAGEPIDEADAPDAPDASTEEPTP
jgi:hypothetical protein